MNVKEAIRIQTSRIQRLINFSNNSIINTFRNGFQLIWLLKNTKIRLNSRFRLTKIATDSRDKTNTKHLLDNMYKILAELLKDHSVVVITAFNQLVVPIISMMTILHIIVSSGRTLTKTMIYRVPNKIKKKPKKSLTHNRI